MLSLHNGWKVMSLHNGWKVKVMSLHKGWKASAVCFPISFFMQWPKSFPELTRWLSVTHQIHFSTDHGSSAQKGPTCPEEPPTVDSREHGWVAAWMCPYPHPAKSAINSNVHKINSCPRDYHLDSFNDSFDILIHLFIVHLVLSRVWDAYSHLKQITF